MKLIGQVCEAVAQVSDAEWEGVRAVYLKKHPDAFWVGLLCQLHFLHSNIFSGNIQKHSMSMSTIVR